MMWAMKRKTTERENVCVCVCLHVGSIDICTYTPNTVLHDKLNNRVTKIQYLHSTGQ